MNEPHTTQFPDFENCSEKEAFDSIMSFIKECQKLEKNKNQDDPLGLTEYELDGLVVRELTDYELETNYNHKPTHSRGKGKKVKPWNNKFGGL